MLVLVTRPRAQAAETARLLRAAGHEALLDALLEVRHLQPPELTPGACAAVAVTSANAAAAAAACPLDLPVFAVGEATARALRAVGRAPVAVAAGDGRDLAALIARSQSPGETVLHLCGRDVREGLAEELSAAGLGYRREVVYETVAATMLAADTTAAIRERRLGAVLLYSPRSAALFAALVHGVGLAGDLGGVIAACLSEAVAAELALLPLLGVRVAEARDQKALLRRLEG